MLIKSRYRPLIGIKTTFKESLRNTSDASFILQSMIDEYLLKKIIPTRLVNVYIITSPFITKGLSLVPYIVVYTSTSNRKFFHLHRFGCLRTIYLVRCPIRLVLSTLMTFVPSL